ncbi:hypothetical protein [Burkholderia ubonensis]|uniref:Uncharacterized protein n=1 Tax=Burkholderia ubonensis subsp. mesacidophila TaxID=265293 RepID=A0A2A4FI10_9BURK|nr:hypothetical protein [Burkholderia ubonensis]PCE33363.1 hypothetical protein BZL54_05660 [Burkholderia ubonensis subsp. mesacidophila]
MQNPGRIVTHGMPRTAQKIRADGLDYSYLLLHLSGSASWRFGRQSIDAMPSQPVLHGAAPMTFSDWIVNGCR